MSRAYWNNRYKQGGTSGEGSRYVKGRARLRYLLDRFNPKEDTILDYGCGDLALWGGGKHARANLPIFYIGVDYSDEILSHNELSYPWAKWLSPEAARDYFRNHAQAEVAICFDVIIHQILYSDLLSVIDNLCRGSKDRIIVSNWVKSPFGKAFTDNAYQYYRPNDVITDLFSKRGFDLHETHLEADGLNALLTYKAQNDKGLS